MYNKKAQAAMEFLMTYGWAIIIILVALAALFFLGVFNPTTSNSCSATPPIICNDVKLVDGGAGSDVLTLILGAGSVNSVTLDNLGCRLTSPPITGVTPSPTAIAIGSTGAHTCTFPVGSVAINQKFSGDVKITYMGIGSTLTHSETVTFTGTVE